MQETIKVDLASFPTDERFIQIPGKLVLADNLENDNFEKREHQPPLFPVQVNMAICFICLSGEMNMEIDLKPYTLTDGYTATILPGSFLQIKHIKQGTKSVFYAISSDFIKHTSNVKFGIELFDKLRKCPVHKHAPSDVEENIMIYNELKKKLNVKDYMFKNIVAQSYIQIILCNTFHHFATETNLEVQQQPQGRKEELFMKFMKAVKEYYTQDRSITFYADKLCISPKYLSSVVHSVSGKYATDWINQCVILEAKNMLKKEGVSIKDVSNYLNFANQSFFAKYFKQHTGYTPKEYKAL